MAAQGRAAARAARGCARARGRLAGRAAARRRMARQDGRSRLMEILLLGIYGFFVWLIFIKFKWLPWNTVSQVIVVIIPIVALTAMILHAQRRRAVDGRRARLQVRRPDRAAGARPGDRGAGRAQPAGEEGRAAVPHRPDAVRERAQRRQGQAGGRRGEARAVERRRRRCLGGCTPVARAAEVRERAGATLQPKIELARRASARTASWWPPAPATASRSSRPKPTSPSSTARSATATANEAQVSQKLSGQVNGEQASVAAARAQFATAKAQVDSSRADVANAQWNLDQTSVYAPTYRLCDQCPVAAGFVRRGDAAGAGDELRRGSNTWGGGFVSLSVLLSSRGTGTHRNRPGSRPTAPA